MTSTEFRAPQVKDAAAIWRAAPQRGSEHDSCYAYLLLCSHFADSGVVAEQGGALAGFALGYRVPMRPQDAFVWQLGFAAGQDKAELGVRLLEEFLSRRACLDARFLTMTSNPQDTTLRGMFQQVARRRGARLTIDACYPSSLFAEPHEDEMLLRIGPFGA